MRGINGFNCVDRPLIEAMNRRTAHRGPDATGVHLGEGVSLGHTRLKIIDLSERAGQPMADATKRYTIVFNGEIYNYRTLREELSYSFQSESDTEVILALYAKHGVRAFSQLRGIFALAIWDSLTRKLVLARDQVGVKPLYYYWDTSAANRGRFIFSSEIKAILEHPITRCLHRPAFNHYFELLYSPGPTTLFQGIHKLPPGYVATLHAQEEGATLRLESYVSTEAKTKATPHTRDLNALTAALVERAVHSQLVADRPVGLYLSGGLDSNIVLDCMARHSTNINSFSVGYELTENEQSDKFNQDLLLARRSAAHYGTHHHEIMVRPDDLPETINEVVWHLDEPISNSTSVAMFALSKLASSSVAVVLGGDGGDELFGGYTRYQRSAAISAFRRIPAPLRDPLSHYLRGRFPDLEEGFERFLHFTLQPSATLRELIAPQWLNPTLTRELLRQRFDARYAEGDFHQQFMQADRDTWLVDESLVRTDKMAMAHGVEARVPLLDYELIAFADSLSSRCKVNAFHGKLLLRRAFRDRLPTFLFAQPKRGWFSPIAKWLRRPRVHDWARSVLSPDYCDATAQLFVWPHITKLLEDHVSHRAYNRNQLLSLLFFQVWAHRFKVSIA